MCYNLTIMMAKLWLGLLVALTLALIALGLGYAYYDTKTIHGVVRDADTQAPIARAAVTVAGRDALTDDAGQFAVQVPRGNYEIRVWADGYDAGVTSVDVSDREPQDFFVEPTLTQNQLGGTVEDGGTHRPIAGAQVRVGDAQVTTDARGSFSLRGLKANARGMIQAPGYHGATLVFTGQTTQTVALVPGLTTVTVTDQYTGAPLAGATVTSGEQTVLTDTAGRAVLKALLTGARIAANAPGHDPAQTTLGDSDQVTLILRAHTLDGVIRDSATGKVIAGAWVYVGSQIVPVNAQGAFHFDRVEPTVSLTIKAAGYRVTTITAKDTATLNVQLEPFLVRGIHLPYGVTRDRVTEVLKMVGPTRLNALVLDLKSDHGDLNWQSNVPLARQIGAVNFSGMDVSEFVEVCRVQGIYCIARLVVFKDRRLAQARPDLALKRADGTLFTDPLGDEWVDAYQADVWNYNIALAKEVAQMGFDEVQFDYVRFPGQDHDLNYGQPSTSANRVAAISSFLKAMSENLRPYPVFISVDLFGLTTALQDDQYIGQKIEEIGPLVDYILPMVYPDLWTASVLREMGVNCDEPVRCPYDIVYNSYKRGAQRTTTRIRLWLQAYVGKGGYGVREYLIQRQAAEDAGSYGWMFWNNQGQYDAEILQ
jgi:hypothetical protein